MRRPTRSSTVLFAVLLRRKVVRIPIAAVVLESEALPSALVEVTVEKRNEYILTRMELRPTKDSQSSARARIAAAARVESSSASVG